MGHHIAIWSFIAYLVGAGLFLFTGGILLVRGMRRPGGLRRLDVLAILADIAFAAMIVAFAWSLR